MDQDIVAHFQGLARAADFIETERMQRLASMTPAESRALFTELIESWESQVGHEAGLERLVEWQLETKVAVRQSFMRVFLARRG